MKVFAFSMQLRHLKWPRTLVELTGGCAMVTGTMTSVRFFGFGIWGVGSRVQG